mgnify:CR=1 FL=1
MKNKIHSLIVEGIVFCGSGLVLLSYSLSSYAKGFNKSWAQSPYLFPLIVAIAMIGLSLWIVGEGVTAMKKEAAVPNDKKVSKEEKTEKRRWVVRSTMRLSPSLKFRISLSEFYLLRIHFRHLRL